MAATLTDSGEITYLSFNIDKVESTPDGDLMVYGRATDGSVDHDQQIVHPDFSSKAIADWLATGGNVRVQHNPQLYPAGVGIEAHTDAEGATWVKSLICEPTAKKLVSKGALRAYSVGIANPTIERDLTGKAKGGIIKAGKIVEISLVDRPANASCGIQLVKSASDGTPEFTNELFGGDALVKALNNGGPAVTDAVNNVDEFEVPAEIKFDFTPNDLMKVLQEKAVARHHSDALKKIVESEKEILGKDHRDFSADRRRDLAGQGNALPDGSYPIPDKDALRRASILARSGHGDAAAARRLIARRARELGVSNPLDDNDSNKSMDVNVDALQAALEKVAEATPDKVTVLPKATKPPMDDDDDDDEDDDSCKTDVPDVVKDPVKAGGNADSSGAPAGKKPKKGKKPMPPWVTGDNAKFSDPASASGAEEAADMDSAPCDGEPLESPKPDHMKSAAFLRYKTIGMDTDLGILHDFTCPAYDPVEVNAVHYGVDLVSSVDVDLWQRKALAAATGKSIAEAQDALQIWQAATALKSANPDEVQMWRLIAHKAFRDANPGPTSFPSPCSMSPKKYNRPLITAGHSATSSGHSGPNSQGPVATGAPNAHSFSKPPMTAGHQSPSPSHMKSSFEYPTQQGVPTSINYGEIEKEKARRALSMLHDHLNHMFPSACPMLDQDAYRQENTPSVPLPAGIGKSETVDTPVGEATVLGDIHKYIQKLERKVRAGEITEAEARTRLSKKTAESYARSLNKQVEEGLTSKEAVLRALGIEMPAIQPVAVDPPVTKAATVTEAAPGLTPDVLKTMMSEILQPLEAKLEQQNQHIENQNTLLGEYQEKFAAQQKELDEHRNRWEALANSADPSSAAFTGLALNPAAVKRAPVDVTKTADINERVTGMMMRQLERAWRTSENPAEREAAYNALMQYRGKE